MKPFLVVMCLWMLPLVLGAVAQPDMGVIRESAETIVAENAKMREKVKGLEVLVEVETGIGIRERERAERAEAAIEAIKTQHAGDIKAMSEAHQRELDDKHSVWLNLVYVAIAGIGAVIVVIGVLSMWGWDLGAKGDGMRGVIMGLLLLFIGSMGVFYAKPMGFYGMIGAGALLIVHIVLDSIGMRRREAHMRDMAHAAALPIRAGLVEDSETARGMIQNAVEPGLARAMIDEELK